MNRISIWILAVAVALAIAAAPALLDGPTETDAAQATADTKVDSIRGAFASQETRHHTPFIESQP